MAQLKKRFGKFSPKNTISGFTTPLHFSHRATVELLSFILSAKKTNDQNNRQPRMN